MSPDPGPSRLRILSTEDDPVARAMLAELLGPEGHEIEFARNSDDFFRLIAAKTYDLLILDVNLPGLNGYQLAREVCVRLGDKRPKMLLLTGRDTQQEKGIVMLSGVDEVLEKGGPSSLILEAVNRLAGRAAAAAAGRAPQMLPLAEEPLEAPARPAPAPPAAVSAPPAAGISRAEYERLMNRVSAVVSENASLSQRSESLSRRLAAQEKALKEIQGKSAAIVDKALRGFLIMGALILAAGLALLLR
ncbi:MAG: response regulator [Elusimicrobia bacterium]|nr:response regulator [Elusimicrobiota bacterium]